MRWMTRTSTAGFVLFALAAGRTAGAAQSPGQVAWGTMRALGLEAEVKEYRFPVSGLTPQNAMSRIGLEGPVDLGEAGAHGFTSFNLRPSWLPVRQPDGCVAQHVRVAATVEIHLPLWTGLDVADEDERIRWHHFEAPLKRHEYAHRDITLRAAAALLFSIRAARASSCPRLVRIVTGIIDRTSTSLDRTHTELDTKWRRQR